MNKLILIGNTGNDPESHTFDNGNKIVKVSLATTENWKDKEGTKKSKTTWHNLVFNRGLAEVVEKYVKKGDKISVVGKIDNYEYMKDEAKHRGTQVIVSEMEMLNSKPKNENEPVSTEASQDDLPF